MSFALAFAALGAVSQYSADKGAAKAKRAWQAYSNTMVRLGDRINQNAITDNEVLTLDDSAEQAFDIKKSLLQSEGAIAVAAGSAGVRGKSVNEAVFDVQRSANIAEGRRQKTLAASFLSFDQQRRQSTFAAELNQDRSFIPKPKFSTYLLKAAGSATSGDVSKFTSFFKGEA